MISLLLKLNNAFISGQLNIIINDQMPNIELNFSLSLFKISDQIQAER
jgi:hypothetical protein